MACRIAAEQGAHIVKTYYCENFEKVVQSCPVPIIVAGGKKIPERDALQLTYNSIKGGAVGVDMGRNIWQSEHPVAMIKAVRSIVHGNSNVEQAYNLYKKLVNESPKKKNKFNKNKSNKTQNKPNQNKSNKPKTPQNKPNQNKSNKPTPKKSEKPQNKPTKSKSDKAKTPETKPNPTKK